MKTVLVTGGTRGLGLEIVRRLHLDGYRIVATGRRLSPGLAQWMDQSAAEGTVSFRQLDLSQTDSIADVITSLAKDHGPLYGLVNNAAIGLAGVLATMHDSQIGELVRVNLLGTILVTKYALRSMLIGGGGRIVHISSIAAATGFNGLSAYSATKAALVGFARSLAREVGRVGITVNCVSPGYMETEMSATLATADLAAVRRRSPMNQFATVGDVASAVAYLLSDDAGRVTGTDLTVDAGSTA